MEKFAKEVGNWLRPLASQRLTFRLEHEVPLEGVSGCFHRIDYTVARAYLVDGVSDDRMLVEVKGMGFATGKRPTYQTYREKMLLAFAELADFRDAPQIKKTIRLN